MGFSQDYSHVPDWVEKPEGYQTGAMVKYEGNVFIANFWASKPGEGDPNENGWRLHDELYDVTSSPADAPTRIIGYIPTWRKKEGFDYANAQMYRNITHGIISFLMFSETNLGEFEPKSVDDVNAIITDVVLTGQECGTYISIALGGAVDYGFLYLMERIGSNPGDPVLQKAVKNVVDFVEKYGLDGVDLDLECWWDKNNDANKDQGGRLKSDGAHPAGKGLTEFAKQLKQAMPDKIISAALFATSWYGNCYDPELVEYVDWLGIMTYDLTGSWNQSPVGPQTALLKIREQEAYAEEQQGEWPGNRKSSANATDPMSDNPILSVEDSLWYWTNPFFTNWQGKGQNLPRNKIAAGVPIYGYDFAYGKDPDDLSGQIAPGYKVIRYKDLLSQFPDAPTAANANIKVPGNTPRPPFVSAAGTYPYAHNIYFETPKTATDKLNFLKSVGAQGVIIWELSNDVWEGNKRDVQAGGTSVIQALDVWEGNKRDVQAGGTSVIQALYQNSGNPATRPVLPSKIKRPDLGDGTSVGDDNFGEGDRYDTGVSPDIALNNGNVVVEVHKSQNYDTLHYHVGKVEGDKINWGGSIKYDDGVEPSVAIADDGLVVEVHKSQSHDTLWYHVGKVEGDKINWGGSIKYDDGVEPSVAITNDGLVVEVHKSQSHDTLWYHVGKVEGDKINWGGSIKYDDGAQPSVAITNDGLVVEVHKSGDFNTLYYHVGRVEGDKINWGGSIKYDDGAQPSVAITNDGLVVEVHTQNNVNLQYSGTGQVNDNTITWRNDKSQNYSKGRVAKVACNGQLAVEAHEERSDKLLCSVLTLPAFRSNWIKLHGENSYCYCACNSATDNKQRHASSKTMNVKEGAPYLYAVLTKDDDSIDFPTGAILTIEGPDGTKYNRDIEEENQLVMMSGSSVRCLIVKDPKAGDWKMTMTVPEGVGFHCECNTVPSKDVYDTITETLNSPKVNTGLQPRNPVAAVLAVVGFIGIAIAMLIKPTEASESQPQPMFGLVRAGTGASVEVSESLYGDAAGMGVSSNASVLAESSRTAEQRENTRTVVRFTTWNMQGGRNLPYLNQVVQRSPAQPNDNLIQILALQETGNLSDSTNFINERPLLDPITGETLGNVSNRVMNDNFMEFLYWENNWAQGGMAVASNIHRGNAGILPAVNVNDFIPRNTRNLPWATVNIPSNNQNTRLTIYTIHAPPVFGNVTVAHVRQWVTAQINQITQREGNNRWILLGDFNLTPEQLGNIPGVHVVHGDRATHQSGNILDYAVTNVQGLIPAPQDNVPGASDHYPAVFEWEQP
ncbi:glycosyl hydrolase family 18 protein [Chroococcidiopsis sp. CCMEE 29]|uniref:glycosyl hydrolase family 18 protein n=1 Tax=Chroococcidiopsis sp. CCMEE 29 TaxID=155894 RepID=UPI00202254A4|nr:glycosyl hydrolase family 18 protein [Chroococcidiopsis sp. CCMEE 29]